MEKTQVLDVNLSQSEYKKLAALIYEESGIDLGDKKLDLLKSRLIKRLRALNLPSYKEYYKYIVDDRTGMELVYMLDAISTNVTSFFREMAHFEYLKKMVIPELLEKRKKERKIRIWSAPCATGEEVYSLLMVIMENISDVSSWDIKILGTDISINALRTAQVGVYAEDRLKSIPFGVREKYFSDCRVKDYLRKYVVFRKLNLMNNSFPFKGKFDVIFCRNVMIYFDQKTQADVMGKLYSYLHNDGYLFIGHSESSIFFKDAFQSVSPAVLKKK